MRICGFFKSKTPLVVALFACQPNRLCILEIHLQFDAPDLKPHKSDGKDGCAHRENTLRKEWFSRLPDLQPIIRLKLKSCLLAAGL
jgi:hypothetical protein